MNKETQSPAAIAAAYLALTVHESDSVEDTAAAYLLHRDVEKAAKVLKDKYRDRLTDKLENGEEVTVRGKVYKWAVVVGKSVSWSKVIAYVHSKVDPGTQALIEEAQERKEFVGVRTTRTLKETK